MQLLPWGFYNMLGHASKDEEQYMFLHKDVKSWPDVNVKGAMCKTHPCATFVFLTNIPITSELREQTADDILSNFKLRFSTRLDYERHEKIPEEFCLFNTEIERKVDKCL